MPPRTRCDACYTAQKPCDLVRPRCGRCTRRGTPCNYLPSVRLSFVDQNAFSAELSRRAADRSPPTLTFASGGLASAPTWTLEHRVLQRFFARRNAGLTILGGQSMLTAVLDGLVENSAIRSAVLATAYADLAVSSRHGDAALRSQVAYLAALRGLQACLNQSHATQDVAGDETTIAILIIDSYELLYLRRTTPFGIHTQAIARIIQLREAISPGDHQSIEPAHSTTARFQPRQLVSGVPSLISNLSQSASDTNRALDHSITRFAANTCDTLTMLHADFGYGPKGQQQAHEFISVLMGRLDEMQEYMEHCSEGGKHYVLPTPQVLHANLPVPSMRRSVITFDHLWVVRNWIIFHMCRIKIMAARIGGCRQDCEHAICSGTDRQDPAVLQHYLQSLSDSCDFLLDTVPFLIGAVNKYGMVQHPPLIDLGLLIVHYPLWTIRQCASAPNDAKMAASAYLQYLDMEMSVIRAT